MARAPSSSPLTDHKFRVLALPEGASTSGCDRASLFLQSNPLLEDIRGNGGVVTRLWGTQAPSSRCHDQQPPARRHHLRALACQLTAALDGNHARRSGLATAAAARRMI